MDPMTIKITFIEKCPSVMSKAFLNQSLKALPKSLQEAAVLNSRRREFHSREVTIEKALYLAATLLVSSEALPPPMTESIGRIVWLLTHNKSVAECWKDDQRSMILSG